MSTLSGSTRTLSEAESKALLAGSGVRFAREVQASDADGAAAAAAELGFPVVLKLNGEGIAHKTERGLVRLNLQDRDAVERAAGELLSAATPTDGAVSLLVAEHLSGTRELIAGLATDPQFGMTVMLGVGGILAEAVADVVLRLVPISEVDAAEMIEDLTMQGLLGPFRGEPAVDREALCEVLMALSSAAVDDDRITSVDLNPLIICGGTPIAVDALVEVRA